MITSCGRLCLYRKKINLSMSLAGQAVGVKEVDSGIPRRPLRAKSVTCVLGTICYLCVRSGQKTNGGHAGTRTPDLLRVKQLLAINDIQCAEEKGKRPFDQTETETERKGHQLGKFTRTKAPDSVQNLLSPPPLECTSRCPNPPVIPGQSRRFPVRRMHVIAIE